MKPSVLFLSFCAVSVWLGSPAHGLLLGELPSAPLRHRKHGRSSHSSRTSRLLIPVVPRLGGPFSTPARTRAALNADDGSDFQFTEGRKADELPSNFNPFNYQRSPTTDYNQLYANPQSNRISLRKARMQEITNQLLQAAASKASKVLSVPSPDVGGAGGANPMMRSILEENREFLLEPLESDDAVLDPDSVLYQGGGFSSSSSPMSRSERYRRYRNELQERIGRAKGVASRRVLQALHDFVLSHE